VASLDHIPKKRGLREGQPQNRLNLIPLNSMASDHIHKKTRRLHKSDVEEVAEESDGISPSEGALDNKVIELKGGSEAYLISSNIREHNV
jgi:hypothetical protein